MAEIFQWPERWSIQETNKTYAENVAQSCSKYHVFQEWDSVQSCLENVGIGDLYTKNPDVRASFDEFLLQEDIVFQSGDEFTLTITPGNPMPEYRLQVLRDGQELCSFHLTDVIKNKNTQGKERAANECKGKLESLRNSIDRIPWTIDAKDLDEHEKDFISRYGKIITQLTGALDIDRSIFYSLIKRESDFDIDAVSATGSTGITQITWSVFRDMNDGGKWRPERYAPYFALIPDELIDQIDGNNKEQLVSALKKAKEGNMLGFQKLNTLENKNNPIFNLILWSVYLKASKEIDTPRINKSMKNVSFDEVNHLLVSKNINISEEAFDNLKSRVLSWDDATLNQWYNALKKYSWENLNNHKYAYAYAVLLGASKFPTHP